MLKTKYHIISLGCASNQADNFKIKQNLLERNACITSNLYDAEVIIILTCGFSKKQYNETLNSISEVNSQKNHKTEIWIGGCVPAINKNFFKEFNFSIDKIFTPRDFEKIIDINAQSEGLSCKSVLRDNSIRLNSYPVRIVNGCTENCSYCVIKKAGGETKSKLIKEIINEINLLDKDIGSISLVGEEVGAFGIDTNESIIALVDEIVRLKPDINISFSSIHPKYFINDFSQYLELFKHDNVKKILPIAIQSGSNKILKLMRREYLIEEVESYVNSIMSAIPSIKVSTDIMVGFPNETWEDFLMTKKIISEFPITSLDCFKFDDMRGIGDTLTEEEKIKRLKIISLTFVKKFCNQNNICSQDQLKLFLTNNYIPINLNY